MEMVTYNDILDNCWYRKIADMDKINIYLDKYPWKDFIIKRHQRIIRLYIDNNYDLKEVGEKMGFAVDKMKALFLRIQSQFEIYEMNKEAHFVDCQKDIDDFDKLINAINSNKEEDIKETNTKKLLEYKTHPQKSLNNYLQGLNTERNEKLEKIKKEIRKEGLGNLKEALGKTIFKVSKDLLNELTIEEIAKKQKLSIKYLKSIIFGMKSGKVRSRKGIIRLIEEYRQKDL